MVRRHPNTGIYLDRQYSDGNVSVTVRGITERARNRFEVSFNYDWQEENGEVVRPMREWKWGAESPNIWLDFMPAGQFLSRFRLIDHE